MKKITTKEAVTRLCEELKKDNGFYLGWQSNIAMSFLDEFNRHYEADEADGLFKKGIHEVANNAAINFLNLLISQ